MEFEFAKICTCQNLHKFFFRENQTAIHFQLTFRPARDIIVPTKTNMDSKNISALYENCIQCPRRCGANRAAGVRGFCGENLELRAAVSCLHFGEEPPLTVFGGSGAIFFTGCTLRCAFCQNYQISQQGFGEAISKSDFAKICLNLQEAGAENINLITGSHHIPILAQFIREAKSAGCALPFCWNSSAYENVESLEALKDCVDIWLPDFKTLDKDFSKKVFLAQDYPEVAKKSISWMIKNFPLKTKIVSKEGRGEKEKILRGVIVRHLFLPGRFEDTANTLAWLKENANGKAMISLMSQYTPVSFREKSEESLKRKSALAVFENRLVSETEDSDLRDLIAAYDFENLFYQELNCDTSWLPDFSKPEPFGNALAKVLWHCK